MRSNTIVILGAGVGGIVAANSLRKHLRPQNRIILIEKDTQHIAGFSLLWLMVGERSSIRIKRDVRSLLSDGIELRRASVTGIDTAGGRIETSAGQLGYDFLITALGAELHQEGIPGLSGLGHSFYTFEGAQALFEGLSSFTGGKIAVGVCSMPYKCPGAPHEAGMLIDSFLRKRGIRDRSQIHIFTPEPQPMPVAGPDLAKAVCAMLESKGIAFHPNHRILSVDNARKRLLFEAGKEEEFDLFAFIAPHRSPAVVRDSGLAAPSGYIPVDPGTLLVAGKENVFAIGDVAAISLPGRWKTDTPLMLPKAGVFAHFQAEAVSQRISDAIGGATSSARFTGFGFCVLETGGGNAACAYGDFFASPSPDIKMFRPGRKWHFGKVLFEKWWLASPGFGKESLRMALNKGGTLLGLPLSL